MGKRVSPMPEQFLKALKNMPEAAGIALGLDRLVMIFSEMPAPSTRWLPLHRRRYRNLIERYQSDNNVTTMKSNGAFGFQSGIQFLLLLSLQNPFKQKFFCFYYNILRHHNCI